MVEVDGVFRESMEIEDSTDTIIDSDGCLIEASMDVADSIAESATDIFNTPFH